MLGPPRNFPGQKPGDEIVLYIRKHWIKYVFVLVFAMLVLCAPLGVVIGIFATQSHIGFEAAAILTVGISVYILALIAILLHGFIDFYMDLFVVTRDRIVFVRQNGFFSRKFDEISLGKIEEVGVDIEGFLRSTFDYGDIIIHSGDDSATLTIDDIGSPIFIARKLMDLHKEFESRQPEEADGAHSHEVAIKRNKPLEGFSYNQTPPDNSSNDNSFRQPAPTQNQPENDFLNLPDAPKDPNKIKKPWTNSI